MGRRFDVWLETFAIVSNGVRHEQRLAIVRLGRLRVFIPLTRLKEARRG